MHASATFRRAAGSGNRAVNAFLKQTQIRAQHSSSVSSVVPPQLFGLSYVRTPADFKKAMEVAIQVCDPLVEAITRDPQTVGLDTLHKLDTISDTICKVLDAAECTRNVHASDEWRASAEDTFQTLASYMYRLNANVPLYIALKTLTDSPEKMAKLNEEQRRMGILLRREFERDGIHLDESSRSAVVALNNEIGAICSEFMSRVHAPPAKFNVTPGGPALACLPPHVRARLPARTFAEKVAGPAGPLPMTTDALLVEYVLRLCRDGGVREQVLMSANMDHGSTLPVIDRLVEARARLAALIGFDSYASLVASDRMAGQPARVIAFLRTLAKALAPRLALECAEMAQAAAAEGETHVLSHVKPISAAPFSPFPILHSHLTSGGTGGRVSLADVPYLSRAVTAWKHWGVAPRRQPEGADGKPTIATQPAPDPLSADAAAVAQFLPFSAALDGLALVMRTVFGVTMVRVPLAKGEGWDGEDGCKIKAEMGNGKPSAPHPTLVKLVLRHDSEGALGTLYLDPFARQGKFGGAAHFVVRCGKRLHDGDGTFESAMGVDMSNQVGTLGGVGGHGQAFQLPIITLVTSMSPPPAAGGTQGAAGVGTGEDPLGAMLLTPGELETLFHEFGHALHSLLSRTQFQHLSGTRGALDFVELPSHVMEYWARDGRAVRAYAKHYITGAPLPSELWDKVQKARSDFAATELASSLANALFDQALHGSPGAVQDVMRGPDVSESAVEYMALAARSAVAQGQDREQAHTIAPTGYMSDEECIIPLAPSDSLHPMPTPSATPPSSPPPLDSTALYHAVASAYTLAPLPGTGEYAWHARFSHLATYGAGYYTYLYATAFSAAVWDKLFAADPFSRAAGDTYRRIVLSKGAAVDPCDMLTSLLGGPPSLAPLLKELGLRK